ncbi:similar to Saccharomyces cerevisiae YFR021W ATG18 Phosphoinositide binding protein required for vesicle formation in autophagy and the cytoplasm-to-vacuole targeting (Cvt) pathway [Maudiozyma barnettii]|uniref:Similar to Saccharomyces cerevisiae YFR021W ATG18 Phosphoinositide binding protein required for vesicle formation in autophagy and the cytoplasm-to-vacuole targeting (Cvt) pathway n=1 Tax=Maudiozyma barnettii TaxID=61262 RepID=A0A8H2VFF0_9SACH|nr:uncharacterized protein KABA2_04S08426 [Kazachstania barnettii]CAB4254532.1 similar to Saccharomyces cerevisiae YFR021W ATG18 Phosphoinositide binding protein required for vesicle formation in autophagy and the cytoplasm-to-vacuole targeting (Cvt) pathway [Kazachstania barnettii]CAD1782574.1 similar to Saccharomyces cerevisiae YFR021W ATG18 Phosphoinositide binding protein required for vesicle formation in autophagy and the cytoplasm-to-vacuole targeting (Cvt) pathway [Kazachstania barnettii]
MGSEVRKHSRYISFNQTGTSICLVNDDNCGFKIINADTLDTQYSDPKGSYSQVQLYFESSLVVLVGLGEDIKFSPRELKLFNIETSRMICHLLYSDTITNVQVNKDRMVVSLTNEIYIYNLTNMKLLHIIKNLRKLNGLISVSMGTPYSNLLIYPTYSTRRKRRNSGRKLSNSSGKSTFEPPVTESNLIGGETGVIDDNEDDYDDEDEVMKEGDIIVFDMMLLRPLMVIEAHENGIQCITMNENGSLIATASKLGTIIRIFNTMNGQKIKEFRRGSYRSTIQSMKFSQGNNFLVVISSSNTIHIFELQPYDINMLQESEVNSNISVKETNEQDHIVLDTIPSSTSTSSISKKNKKTSMSRLIKKSSKKLTREANKRFNQLFIGDNIDNKDRIKIITERHFAWCKFQIDKIKERGNSSVIDIDSRPIILNKSQLIQLQNTTNMSNKVPITETADNNSNSNNKNEDECEDDDGDGDKTSLIYLRIKILTSDGNLYTYLLDPINGGECILQSQLYLLH